MAWTRLGTPNLVGMNWFRFGCEHIFSHSQLKYQQNLVHFHPVLRSLLLDRPTVDLISAMETQSEPSELELDDVVITNPHIEAILENEDWIEDASYVEPQPNHLSDIVSVDFSC